VRRKKKKLAGERAVPVIRRGPGGGSDGLGGSRSLRQEGGSQLKLGKGHSLWGELDDPQRFNKCFKEGNSLLDWRLEE